jgi:two-component system sensor histidine kinase/response regulator
LTENAIQKDRCTVKAFSSADTLVEDTYLQETQGGRWYSRNDTYLAVSDIYAAGFDTCYLELLEQFQARAYITVPIFCGTQLWGLLATYQNAAPRQWKTSEMNMVVQIGNQLEVALQQAELLAQTRQQSAALQKAAIAANAANRAKSEFLAVMSHELRTPLNAILGFTQVMSRDRALSQEQQEHLGIINRAGEHLLELINDILEMSKIESGGSTFNEHNFDLLHLLTSLEQMFGLQAQAKGLRFLYEYDPNLPRYVQTDESKLRQVLINLLGNALKFTQSGGVTLRVKLGTGDWEKSAPLTQNSNQAKNPLPTLRFEVEDTGPGIAPEEINLLFTPFGQTAIGRQSQQGTGLGLPISRKYVQLMGGDIQVRSTPGQGSIFAFEIQIAQVQAADIQIPHNSAQVIGLAPDQPEYRILVVDDRLESRLFLFKLLTLIGFQVQSAENGQQAVELWSSWQPNLICMDMQMPVMDGYEATRQIKGQLLGQSTVIIALTASAFEEERQTILAAGCDDFVRKPFRESVLLEKISLHLGLEYEYAEETQNVTALGQTTEEILSAVDLASLFVQMPAEWLAQLHNAAAQGSDELILNLSQQIPPENIALVNILTRLANNFHFEKIMELTQQQ